MLMSDLHIGASCVDYQLIERDLKRARDAGALVLLNGDVQTPEEALAGRRSTYAQDVNMAPQATGGVLLRLCVHAGRRGSNLEVAAEAAV